MSTKSINRVTLLGHLGGLPEIKETENGRMATMSIATNDGYLKDGEWQETTAWHRVVTFKSGTIDVLEKGMQQGFVNKGTRVHLEGKLQYSTSEKDGDKKYFTDIVENDLILL